MQLCAPSILWLRILRADLNVGRERRNGEVDKGPWKDACSATYGFAPEPAAYSKATEKLAASILVP